MTAQEVRDAILAHGELALEATLYGEARGESIASQIAVAWTVRNRVDKPKWWGDTYATVCLKKWQYSCWWDDTPNMTETVDWAQQHLLNTNPMTLPDVVVRLSWVTTGVMQGWLPDPTHGATHYCTHDLLMSHPPLWARGQPPVAIIGSHVFFANVP